MSTLEPLETLWETDRGRDLPLPPELRDLYGRLAFPLHPGRPHVIGNFVATLDGVTSLLEPGHEGGGPISGFNPHDQLVMGLLRAAADAVIVGAGTLRVARSHVWTAAQVFPVFADAYQKFRLAQGKPEPPLTVIVTARGDVDPGLRVFRAGGPPVLIVTTPGGGRHLRGLGLPSSVLISEAEDADRLSARSILNAVVRVRPGDLILVEGGPHLLGDFFAEQCLDEQFLTLAPQIAGREDSSPRPGLVAGKHFAPERPLWGSLVGVKRAGDYLFLRHAFPHAM